MSLREELARRLGLVYRTKAGWQSPEVHWGDRDEEGARVHNANRLLFLEMADECIRQMEWARRRNPWVDQSEYDRSPMTVAPEGWKP